jgi:hypothetical protein
MADGTTQTGREPGRRAREAQAAIRRIALVALLGVALGLLMQVLIIALRLAGGVMPGLSAWADLAQTVTWSVLVCTGVAVGMAIGKARTMLAGMLAALFAPLAMAAAKSMQKVVASLVAAAEQPALLSLTTLGVVRAVEYGLLAFVLAVLAERKERRLLPYAAAGGVTGLVFGGAVVVLTYLLASLDGRGRDGMMLASLAITELGSPLGCALVIYVAQAVATQTRLWERGGGSARRAEAPPRVR